MSRQEWLDYSVRMAVEEGNDFDMIAMGRSRGAGLLCAANHNAAQRHGCYQQRVRLRRHGQRGRHGASESAHHADVDHLLLVSDASLRGLVAAEAMVGLTAELEINVRNSYLVVNRVIGPLPDALQAKVEQIGIPLLATVPYDAQLVEFDGSGRPLVELPRDAPVSARWRELPGSCLTGSRVQESPPW